MSNRKRLLDLFEDKGYQRKILMVLLVSFLVLELLIFIGAVTASGEKSRVVIYNREGHRLWETKGSVLTSYQKLVLESSFGPLENYRIQIEKTHVPFPVRAWLAAAVGIPIGLMLLISLVVWIYLSLMYGEEGDAAEKADSSAVPGSSRFGSLFFFFQRFSVFHIAFLIVLAVFLLWMIPNLLSHIGRISLSTIREFRWFFAGIFVFLGFLITWVIYLRYKLSQKMLENQFHLEKTRIEQHVIEVKQPLSLLPEMKEEGHSEEKDLLSDPESEDKETDIRVSDGADLPRSDRN